jgi:hypothetical protein
MTVYAKLSDISDAIVDKLEGITKANGAETDIGLRTYRGRRNVDETAVPCVVLIEGPDSVTDRPGKLPTVAVTQRYVIAAYVHVASIDNPNVEASAAVRDIKRAIFAGDGDFGGRVLKVSYKGRDIGPRADGLPIVFVTVDIDVEYVEDLTNP